MDVPVFDVELEIQAQSAVALRMARGDVLSIIDRFGEQVADLALYDARDVRDGFSPGRTIDYNESLRLARGDVVFSHRSTPLARVVRDTVGVHDILLAPCSSAMFARRGEFDHPSCHNSLAVALADYGISDDAVTATVNVFMNVGVDREGRIRIGTPASRPGDVFAIEALCDLIAGVSA